MFPSNSTIKFGGYALLNDAVLKYMYGCDCSITKTETYKRDIENQSCVKN